MNLNKEAKSLTFWRGSEVSQVTLYMFDKIFLTYGVSEFCRKCWGWPEEVSNSLAMKAVRFLAIGCTTLNPKLFPEASVRDSGDFESRQTTLRVQVSL